MSETVLRRGVDGLSLIGLASTCRAANLLAKANVDLQEEGLFTRSDLEELYLALDEFTQRWQIGGKHIYMRRHLFDRADDILAICRNTKLTHQPQ
jgi:hypothetical protein